MHHLEEAEERSFFKKPDIIDGFKVFDVYMNKKSEMNTRRKATVVSIKSKNKK